LRRRAVFEPVSRPDMSNSPAARPAPSPDLGHPDHRNTSGTPRDRGRWIRRYLEGAAGGHQWESSGWLPRLHSEGAIKLRTRDRRRSSLSDHRASLDGLDEYRSLRTAQKEQSGPKSSSTAGWAARRFAPLGRTVHIRLARRGGSALLTKRCGSCGRPAFRSG